MKKTHTFQQFTDRYAFDFGICSRANGFAQVDTSQDASYYGTWANPFTLTIINYREGDVYTTVCADAAEFAWEVRKIKQWNKENGRGFYGIDPGFSAELKAQFVAVGLEELLH